MRSNKEHTERFGRNLGTAFCDRTVAGLAGKERFLRCSRRHRSRVGCLGDGLVANHENGTDSDAVADVEIGTALDAAFDRTVTVSGYTIRVTAAPEVSSFFASEITDMVKKATINRKVSEEAGKETTSLVSFDFKVFDLSGYEVEPDITKGKSVVTFGK